MPSRPMTPVRAAIRIAQPILAALLLGGPAWAAPETPVFAGAGHQEYPTGSEGYLAYVQHSNRRSNYTVYLKPDTGAVVKVNPPNTWAVTGDLDGQTLVFQEVSAKWNRSDIRALDATTLMRLPVPAAVNSKIWEWAPNLSGDWLFFQRNNLEFVSEKREWKKLILYNTATSERRVIAKVRGDRSWLYPADIAGDYAVWERCRRVCEIFLYRISTNMNSLISDPAAHEFAPAVTSDGTVYYVRAPVKFCRNTSIVRRPLSGMPTTIATIADGFDTFTADARVNGDGSVDYYYDRADCERYRFDIYRIEDADTAAPVSAPAGAEPVSPATVEGSPQEVPHRPRPEAPALAARAMPTEAAGLSRSLQGES